ncbi:ribbon-helix-helix protein, CopG family [Phormidium tenue FACHB-886]|nr:ribbon-helix-helix protein, CopG family [Phormidium tenue FACHB-886]
MPKGHKRTRGIPELHDELKKRVNFSLTPKAVEGLDLLATDRGLSRSELIEQIGRRRIPLGDLPNCDSRKLDPSVFLFMEEAIQSMPPLEIKESSKIQVLPFAERASLPNSPGAFIVSDWIRDFYGSDMDLRHRFQDYRFIEVIKDHFDGLPDNLFILWLTCDARLLKFVWSDIRAAFESIRDEVLSRSLTNEMRRLEPSANSEE